MFARLLTTSIGAAHSLVQCSPSDGPSPIVARSLYSSHILGAPETRNRVEFGAIARGTDRRTTMSVDLSDNLVT